MADKFVKTVGGFQENKVVKISLFEFGDEFFVFAVGFVAFAF